MSMLQARSIHTHGVRVPLAAAALLLAIASMLVPAAAHAGGTLTRIKDAGKITLGYRADARPFSYRDPSGTPAGYSVDLCSRVAEQVKADLQLPALAVAWVPVTREEALRAVAEGKVDVLCEGAHPTLAERRNVAYSIPIFPDGTGALVRADASSRLRDVLVKGRSAGPFWRGSPAQILEAQRLSVVPGSSSAKWLGERADALEIAARVVPVDSYDAGVNRVLDRSTDVFFGSRALLLDAVKTNPRGRDLALVDRHFTYEPVALAVPRDDDDFRLAVDRALSRTLRSGGFGDLYAKWFGAPGDYARNFFQWSAVPD
jgi:ABC-type amino acid transport substrate-binding protein